MTVKQKLHLPLIVALIGNPNVTALSTRPPGILRKYVWGTIIAATLGLILSPGAQAQVAPLSLTAGYNYDGYISQAEANHSLLYNPPSNWTISARTVSSVFGEHSPGVNGRSYSWSDQTTSGLPASGALTTTYGTFLLNLARDSVPSGGYVLQPTGAAPVLPQASNVIRVSRPHSGSTVNPDASHSFNLPVGQQTTYDSINFLVSGNNGKVLIYADYDNGSGGIDQQLIYQSPGTPKTASETGFPELVGSTSTNPDLVPALSMDKYWGQSSNYSNISTGTATIWTFANPIPLDPEKILRGLTLAVYNADTWKARSAVFYAASANVVVTRPTYYVDAVYGSDSNDGTSANPYQTIAHVLPLLSGGEDVILRNGSYGNVSLNKNGNIFSDWVVFKAAPGATPELGRFTINGPAGPQNQTGGYNAYVRLENLILRDGWQADGAKHWALSGCLIERIGPWTGSVSNIEKTAISFRGGTDITIEGCEVTRTGTGIAGRGHEVAIRGCHIHNGTHDGIRVTGFWNSIVEDNVINSFDDGVTDAEATWSRHCDLIHIFIPGPAYDGWENNNVLFRNNVLYDSEAQGVQFNNYLGRPELRNKNIVFENNIFGPTQANLFNNADPTDGLTIRHNTVVYFPGGRTFGRWTLNNHNVRIGPSTGIQVYNNALYSIGFDAASQVDYFDWNILQSTPTQYPMGVDEKRAYGRFTQTGINPQFVNASAFDGALLSTSPLINLGTSHFAPEPVPLDDIVGTARDLRPDIGAWEFPGLTPVSEPLPTIINDSKTVFLDDFEDGHYNDVDDWLNSAGQQGLSWYRPDPAAFKYFVQNHTGLTRNALIAPIGVAGQQRIAWLFSEQGNNWAEYDLTFKAFNNYSTHGTGPVFLAQNENNCYWIDIGLNTGKLIRILNGVSTELATDVDLRLPNFGAKIYKVSVRQVATGIAITVDVGNNNSVDFTYIDTDATAKSTFTTGGIGLHENNSQINQKAAYDDFRVDVISVD